MKPAYVIRLPKDQASVPVGRIPALVAQAMHPEQWEFWEGKEAQFEQLAIWMSSKVSDRFPGEVDAAREVRSRLNSQKKPNIAALAAKLNAHHFYQIYIGAVHQKLLNNVVGRDLPLISRSPFGAKPIIPDDFGGLEFSPNDRVLVEDLASHLNNYGVLVDWSGEEISNIKPPKPEDIRPAQGVDEERGRVILKEIRIMGYDPVQLPHYKKGNSIKDQLKKRMAGQETKAFERCSRNRKESKNGDNRSQFERAFDRAWEWLVHRDQALIQWESPED